MVFSSLTFLFAYLPVVFALYFLVPRRYKNTVLFLVSLFFYGWGEPIYILVMLASITFNWIFGLRIHHNLSVDRKKAKLDLIICLVLNILILGFFKYSGFLINNLRALGLSGLKPFNIRLPIGISFYTFQTMSYPIDLYRGKCQVQRNYISFGAYVAMFPQLIAGPIVLYTDIEQQLAHRDINADRFSIGITRFMSGLAKKVLLANNIGLLWENISALSIADRSITLAWLGIIAYAFQIYFDFSGYSDMAIGLGQMLGFDFPENFNYPYIANSITDFWRRWHMTLSYWFRDYVYIPLGGNRKGFKRQVINILIVWMLTGLWHGAAWNFILWGLIYGVLLIVEKLLWPTIQKLPSAIRHFYTLLIVLIAWVFFASNDIASAFAYLTSMFAGSTLYNGLTTFYLRNNIVLLLSCVIACTPYPNRLFDQHKEKLSFFLPLFTLLGLLICVAFIVDASYNPFLYFRF